MPRQIGLKSAEPYKERVADNLRAALQQRRSGAVMAPTGSGKSLMIHTTVEDALALGRPILVLHPNVQLLRQNLAQLRESDSLRKVALSVFVAAQERFPELSRLTRDTFNADLVLATNMSFVNRRDNPPFLTALKAFCKSGGIILIDEGQAAAAPELSELLSIAAENDANGYLFSATPFRADGRDPLAPFGATLETHLIDVVEYNEVLKTGRIVPTKFDLAYEEFESALTPRDIELIEAIFDDALRSTNSADAASQEAFARLFRPDLARGVLSVSRKSSPKTVVPQFEFLKFD